ncbi:MAG: DEAD/DEAH box helicase family protein [Erysipelotrichales bacterium]|nr:DEAD/DEAH box helicase family protein [Erysipelotrichales bacterium]
MSNINYPLFPEYTLDYLNNVMSLRKPQFRSLRILDDILRECPLSKEFDVDTYQRNIMNLYRTFREFERPFFNVAFELATGVGKTKLMGAFITYLYTNKGVKNFFVVAPSLTIYSKLKNDLGNPAVDNEKYVFRGIGCFATETPNVWFDDDYRNRPSSSFSDSDSINIFIFNISKFNSEERKMMSVNEYLGQSFFDYLKSLDDLVVIMDESHHYRADASTNAINSLEPILGIELTATPYTTVNNKQVNFKNAVYEYVLKDAILDGYTRTPYVITRQNMKKFSATEVEMDLIMLNDGIKHHRNMQLELIQYHKNTGARLVKPFMLVVCKNTDHAEKIVAHIKSLAFYNGEYKDKVAIVHSNQRGSEKDENIQLLLEVEKNSNPVEIVVHVSILKEGWDVNNLYTIVPLRTATSKVLREQTIGRGLRLPFGKRTGEQWIDSVSITAHDKFDEIIAEAQSGDSIFKKDGVIYSDQEKEKRIVHQTLFDTNVKRAEVIENAGLDHNDKNTIIQYETIMSEVQSMIIEESAIPYIPGKTNSIKERIIQKDLGKKFEDSQMTTQLLEAMFRVDGVVENMVEQAHKKIMYIPQLKTTEFGEETYIIRDFQLDFSKLVYTPITDINIIKKSLTDNREAIIEEDGGFILSSVKPEKRLVDSIRQISEIDYEKATATVQSIVKQFLTFYRNKYSESEVNNICTMYIQDITEQLKSQLLQNLAVVHKGIVEVVSGIETKIVNNVLNIESNIKDIYEAPETGTSIKSLVYSGANKAVVSPFKFDSNPERIFALVCEHSPEVIQWLRPNQKQFNITYDRNKLYVPDFVVETATDYYLVEVKGLNMLDNPQVKAKQERAIQYCKLASEYNIAHRHKPFTYLFIPEDQFDSSTTFRSLVDRLRN